MPIIERIFGNTVQLSRPAPIFPRHVWRGCAPTDFGRIGVVSEGQRARRGIAKSVDNGGRLWVIGDIHGYYDSFFGLVSKLNLDDGDLVISIGDMIDGGPESVGVVDFFIENDQFLAILGNHEQMLLDYWNKKSKFDLFNLK